MVKNKEDLFIKGALNPDYAKGKIVRNDITGEIAKVLGFDIKNIKKPLNEVKFKVITQDGNTFEWLVDKCTIL